jgi:hypothetical protein
MKPSHSDTARYAAPRKEQPPSRLGWWHRALRELANELEGEEGGAVVEWDPVFKVPVMKIQI